MSPYLEEMNPVYGRNPMFTIWARLNCGVAEGRRAGGREGGGAEKEAARVARASGGDMG